MDNLSNDVIKDEHGKTYRLIFKGMDTGYGLVLYKDQIKNRFYCFQEESYGVFTFMDACSDGYDIEPGFPANLDEFKDNIEPPSPGIELSNSLRESLGFEFVTYMPDTFEKLIELLKYYLKGINCDIALNLLEKALAKAQTDSAYANKLQEALLKGSTIEGREAFAYFGDYLAIPYDHSHGVNTIDSALLHIKCGHVEEAISDYNFLHNRS